MTTSQLPIAIDPERIGEFCRARGIGKLSLFGSVLRDDFTPESDVDVLVEYLPGKHPGLDLFTHQDELARLFARRVDLHTPASLSKYFRDEVLAGSLPLYE